MSTHAFPGAGSSRRGWWVAAGDEEHGPRGQRGHSGRERRGQPGRRGRRDGAERIGVFGTGGLGPDGFGLRGGRGHGPWGRPGRGRRGDVRAAILVLLEEGPCNGYQLMSEIAERSSQLWKPSPGSVYPALAALEDEGLIEPTEVDGKKLYQLSDAGRSYLAEHADQLTSPWDAVSNPWKGVLQARKPMMQVNMALQQIMLTGDADVSAKAQAVLQETVRSLYRLLAEQVDEADEPGADQ